jgi:hypothetical protein
LDSRHDARASADALEPFLAAAVDAARAGGVLGRYPAPQA